MAAAHNNGRLGEKHEWELPQLRESHTVANAGDFWDVKFYPYAEAGVDTIFAVVGGKHILVCRAPEEKNIEILLSITDDEPENENYTCAWSKNLETGTPLLCVGGKLGKIKVINGLTGDVERVLAGHGGDINSLEVSPSNPYILASGSEDFTARIWSLDPAHEKQPCAAILTGDGHRETILSVSFHETGRYLLTAGIDHVINLWVLPSFPDSNTGTHKPTRIHYPHFSTSEVHSTIVDCISFYHDLILSKAEREGTIVLWSITGFSPSSPTPPPLSAPTTHDSQRDTRSAFTTSSIMYTRLLQFSTPDCDIMCMRFGLFPGLKNKNEDEEKGAVLAICNSVSKVLFWDLRRLEEVWEYMSAVEENLAHASTPIPAVAAQLSFSSSSSGSTAQSHSQSQGQGQDTQGGTGPRRPKFLIPFKPRTRGGGGVGRPPLHSRIRDIDSPSTHDTNTNTNTNTNTSNVSERSTPISAHTHTSTPQPAPNPSLNPAQQTTELAKEYSRSLPTYLKKYGLGDAERELGAHKEDVVKGFNFTGRQAAWSPGGEWCVVVGSAGVIAVFGRW